MAAVAAQAEGRTATPLEALLGNVGELLPHQAPLHAFVHHNTLHHFEHLPFDEGVIAASRVFGTEGFQSEEAFRVHLESGRISSRDIEEVVRRDGGDAGGEIFAGGPTRQEFKVFRLHHLFEVPTGATLRWQLEEGEAASRLRPELGAARRNQIRAAGDEAEQLARLWNSLERLAPSESVSELGVRWRDRLLESCGVDTDEWVHPLLIRQCAAFLDQGVAYWPMPHRERGFLSAVRRLYGLPLGPPLAWSKGLEAAFQRQEQSNWTSEETVEWALEEMCVCDADREAVVRATLLSLRGWAGMMRELELHPDLAPVEALPASLMDFLAVQLCFDLFAARAVLFEYFPKARSLADVEVGGRGEPQKNLALVYEAYVLAQLSDVPLAKFEIEDAAANWIGLVDSFNATERRRLLHKAYERRHRVEVLDAIAFAPPTLHATEKSPPRYQAIFCIDDREESLRRHLEQVQPNVETFGYAGFFGVAMRYQGIDDIRSKPLCPVAIKPRHLITEVAKNGIASSSYPSVMRRKAVLRHAGSVGARTLVRGGLLSSVFGPLWMVPLVGHTLFPRVAHRVGEWLRAFGVERPETRLVVESESELDVEGAVRTGYSVSEMADVVASAVRTMGLDLADSSLLIVVGHGSSSVNNPYGAAYDCGATGGGRGGPNARAFAWMANHSPVRDVLASRGLKLRDELWFVGAFHNTCDDSMTYYDEDLIPDSVSDVFVAAKADLATACAKDAHERCRRFETAPLGLSVSRALEDVEERAVDLAQPRPECGHATNAVCIVGRRGFTRNLFLDRRAFLVSYDPEHDPEGELLGPLLMSVGPVGAGINLEYYFSYVDPRGYGSGTKLPHNISGLLGVMDGHASDLRTGLPRQMVEIHEPVRLLTIVEAPPALLERLLRQHEPLRVLVDNGWIQFVSRHPESGELKIYDNGGFRPHEAEAQSKTVVRDSAAYYSGRRDNLAPVWLANGGTQ